MEQAAATFEKSGNPYKDALLALEHSACPYLIIGGLAVVLHGSNRFTPDVNILVDFSSDKLGRVIQEISSLGFQPANTMPVNDLHKAEVRKQLIEKGNDFVTFADPQLPNFSVDILLHDIGSFESLVAGGERVAAFGTEISVLGLSDLLDQKKQLNRMQDQVDVMQLEFVQQIRACPEPENAFESLQDVCPPGFDEAFYNSLVSFQKLNPDERFDWLQSMLAAVGGFCMF